MEIQKQTTVTGSLDKIVKTPAIFLLLGLMGFTFLAKGQGIIIQDPRAVSNYWKKQAEAWSGQKFLKPEIKGDPRRHERHYTGPNSKWANKPFRSRARVVLTLADFRRKFNTPSYTAPNYTPQLQSGRTLQWKTGAGQQNRLDRLYVGRDAKLVLQVLGRPDKVSWQYDTWTYQNLNIENLSTRRQYRNVTFAVKKGRIKVASVY